MCILYYFSEHYIPGPHLITLSSVEYNSKPETVVLNSSTEVLIVIRWGPVIFIQATLLDVCVLLLFAALYTLLIVTSILIYGNSYYTGAPWDLRDVQRLVVDNLRHPVSLL